MLLTQVSFASAQNVPENTVPRIDDEAAYIEKKTEIKEERNDTRKPVKVIERGPEATVLESEYSQNFWVFILGTYLFLMVFNLSADFGETKSIQWFWVSVFTFLAIFSWDNMDASRSNTWFPKLIMETGIIIYLFYLYFFNKNRINSTS